MLKKFDKFGTDERLIESCGSVFHGCGGGSSSSSDADREEARRQERIKRRQDRIDEILNKCTECGTKLAPKAKFCQECGEKVL